MSSAQIPRTTEAVVYPDSDGLPMADNTAQFRWITTIKAGLDVLSRDRPDVFVAGDLLWYPAEGDNATRVAPDVLVAFGRPKGERGSYRQWDEGGVAPHVVFEVLSPGNRPGELARKLRFYDRHGVEEYYLHDPGPGPVALAGWLRGEDGLGEIPRIDGWTSPRLGVRFDLDGGELRLIGPDGRPFLTAVELAQERDHERARADVANRRALDERARADDANRRAADERARAERLAARLRELGEDFPS